MRPPTPLVLAALLLAACDSPGGTPGDIATTGDVERGRTLFAQNCAECHSVNARGTDKGPPLIHKIYEPNHHADIAFVLAARQGVRAHHWPYGDMPPLPGVNEEQVHDIIAWVRGEQHNAGIW